MEKIGIRGRKKITPAKSTIAMGYGRIDPVPWQDQEIWGRRSPYTPDENCHAYHNALHRQAATAFPAIIFAERGEGNRFFPAEPYFF